MENVTALPYLPGSRVLKHTQITGNLKVSASKKRKHHQQMIKRIIENVIDTSCQASMVKENRLSALANRAEKYRAKYGVITYAANGVDIADIVM